MAKQAKTAFEDLGFNQSESLAMQVKADIYRSILSRIDESGLTPRQLERTLNVPQPRVSELLNGKFSMMSIEKLLEYSSRLGAAKAKMNLSFNRRKSA